MKFLCALVGVIALMMSLALSANERIAKAANALKSGDYATASWIAVPLDSCPASLTNNNAENGYGCFEPQ